MRLQPLSVAQNEKARVCCRLMQSSTQSRMHKGEPAGAGVSLAYRAECARCSCSGAGQPVQLSSTRLQRSTSAAHGRSLWDVRHLECRPEAGGEDRDRELDGRGLAVGALPGLEGLLLLARQLQVCHHALHLCMTGTKCQGRAASCLWVPLRCSPPPWTCKHARLGRHSTRVRLALKPRQGTGAVPEAVISSTLSCAGHNCHLSTVQPHVSLEPNTSLASAAQPAQYLLLEYINMWGPFTTQEHSHACQHRLQAWRGSAHCAAHGRKPGSPWR